MYCRNCGSEIRSGASFCNNCGTKVQSNTKRIKRKSVKRNYKLIMLCILLVAISGVIVFSACTHISKSNLQSEVDAVLREFCQYISEDPDNKYGDIEGIIARDVSFEVLDVYRKPENLSHCFADCLIVTYDLLSIYDDLVSNIDDYGSLTFAEAEELIVKKIASSEKVSLNITLELRKVNGKIALVYPDEFVNACYGGFLSMLEKGIE